MFVIDHWLRSQYRELYDLSIDSPLCFKYWFCSHYPQASDDDVRSVVSDFTDWLLSSTDLCY